MPISDSVLAARSSGATGCSFGDSRESPNEQPVAPEDLAASTLSLMGIRPDDAYQAPNGRPIQWVKDGSIIKGLS